MAHSGRLGVEAALVGGELVLGDVEVVDGRVAAVALNSSPGKGIAAPGFIDLQVNGFAGVDFFSADADGYRRAGAALLECGVTAYQPTFITSPENELTAALHEVPRNGAAPRILGAHLEGPFIVGSATRPRLQPAQAVARSRPGESRHACARASRCIRARRSLARTWCDRVVRTLECDCRSSARGLRARGENGDAHLQRHASVRRA